jgi:hypothetical protein
METQRDAAMRESPEERGIEEARMAVARAERARRAQVKGEEAGLPTAPYVGLRGLLPSVCLPAIILCCSHGSASSADPKPHPTQQFNRREP